MPHIELTDIKYLCFGVGGANGWVHVGILMALERELIRQGTTLGERIEGVSGASIGSLLALAVAMKFSATEISEFLRTSVEEYKDRFETPNLLGLASSLGLMSTDVLRDLVRDLVSRKYGRDHQDMTLGELHRLTKKRLYIATHNMTKMRGEILDHVSHPDLPLHKAVCMSSAIPGIFQPVLLDNSLYVDAAMSNELPYEVFNDMDSTLAFYLAADHKAVAPGDMSVLDFFSRLMSVLSLTTEAKINALPQHIKHHVLWLRVPCLVAKALQGFLLEDEQRERLIEIGAAAGSALVHYKMAVLSQAAILWLSSRRGLAVPVHAPPPEVAHIGVGDGAALLDGAYVPAQHPADAAAAVFGVVEGEPLAQCQLDDVRIDPPEELVP